MAYTRESGRYGRFTFGADYYRIYTWKGYEGKDLDTVDPLYLNAQGDKGNAQLLVLTPGLHLSVNDRLGIDVSASYYLRDTHYKYYDDVSANTFTAQIGLAWKMF